MIQAVFEHDEGYKFSQAYKTKGRFLSSIKRVRNASFLHAIDYDRRYVVYPSNINQYKTSP